MFRFCDPRCALVNRGGSPSIFLYNGTLFALTSKFAVCLPFSQASPTSAEINQTNHASHETNIALTNFGFATQQLTPNRTAIRGAKFF